MSNCPLNDWLELDMEWISSSMGCAGLDLVGFCGIFHGLVGLIKEECFTNS